jgi:phospholipase D1/2
MFRAIMDYQYKSICRGGHSIMELIAKAGVDPHEYSLHLTRPLLISVRFFNLRSFDRIPLTQQVKNQEKKSGIDTVKADIALGLDLNGLESFGNQGVGVASSPTGDPMDAIRHETDKGKLQQKILRPKNTKKPAGQTDGLGEMFNWNESTDSKGRQQKLNQVLSSFEGASTGVKVSETIAQHGMMTGENVFDERWNGDESEAVKNFVSEELYIHTKVPLFLTFADNSL